ncbi:MAG: nucleotide sugar dehydrogenase [Cellvibrionales bacterium]|nr:nucleotide sugar dehydrogenase [Cellvibrionales bacterium]
MNHKNSGTHSDKKDSHTHHQPSEKVYKADHPKNISIIGLGYVGAVSSACFASMGHSVIGVDIDQHKVDMINQGLSPILEYRLDELLLEGHNNGRISATTSIMDAIAKTQVTLISVCTPSADDGSCDTTYLEQAAQTIGEALKVKEDFHVLIFRSTVPPSTTENVLIPLIEKYSGKTRDVEFGTCFNPEFLRESTAIMDFYDPPKTVVGSNCAKSAQIVKEMYGNVEGEFFVTSIKTAEFTKYIDNTWHALKVSFGNELGRLCKAMHVDSHEVMNIFCQDTHLNISPTYLMPGFAYGGSCLPKDTRGITHMASQLSVSLPVISHINQSNKTHIEHTLDLIDTTKQQHISIVGLTFKPDTDDLRESPALILFQLLKDKGLTVHAYDPYISASQLDMLENMGFTGIKASFTDDINKLYSQSDVLVVTHNSAYAQSIVEHAPKDQHIIDVARLPQSHMSHQYYSGICW